MATDSPPLAAPSPAAAPAAVRAWPLTEAQRAVFAAAAATIVPCAATDEGGGVDVVRAIAERIARMPEDKRRDLLIAVGLFGHPVAALLTTGSWTPFAARDDAGRERFLRRWATMRLGVARTVAQTVRRLVLACYYGDPRSFGGIGYLGAYHTRRPAYPWEGPPPGTTSDDEPIVRGADRAAPPPAPAPRITPPRPDPLPPSCDVVVIGTGAGGAVAATRFAEAGRSVVMLEEGSLVQSDEFSEADAPMTERLMAEQGLRATEDQSLMMMQGSSVGGSTTVNWMIMLRAADGVFAEWQRRFGTAGMSPAEMADAYARIEHEVHCRRVPDDAHSRSNRLLLDGAAALGWRARGASVNARGCVRSGFCSHGCRYDAKQGTLVAFVPRAVAAGARLVPDARVARIEVREPGSRGRKRVVVERRDPATGRRWTEQVEAPVVVVAGGAVGTPALLLRSGLGSPAVGRYLRVHPVSGTGGIYPDPVYSAGGIPMTTLCDEFASLDDRGYGVWIETPPTHPAVFGVAIQGWGETHRNWMRRFPSLAAFLVLTRDGADPDASSGDVRVGRDGRVRIRYRLTPADLAHLRIGLEKSAQLHFAAGATEVFSLHTDPVVLRSPADLPRLGDRPMDPNDFALFTAHVNGTCRLGTDPATSGADPDGQVHGVPGVYVLDGSLLPTGLGVNPQATIMAISSLLADRMLAEGRV